ncbi:MAG: YYY membrane protein [Candidatus Woesebacteria bacterium GW2011_GWA1_39_12]|uniref:YYY membrane protein n=3 Tax=Candidatus Woeseibacteriota TaxID=1752722 RepID=A0A0G0Q5Q4_9BACT|nr:MAG: YYY membrane protein [Candidatus Woesebacteria bacterium GW2011_GWA1_39_12]
MLADIPSIFYWWVILFSLGLFSFPLTWSLLRKFFDSGYGLSKIFGIIVPSYLVFLFSTLHILPLNQLFIFGIFAIYIILNFIIYAKNNTEIKEIFRKKLKIFLLEEFLFIAGLFAWSYVRAHQPDIRGLEKFMDFGFINSILRSEFLPPADMWAAGKTINYYWFGHLMTAVLTKLSGIPGAITYNLMLGTILGLTLSSAFSIASSLLASSFGSQRVRIVIVGGVLSALLLGLGGNFHAPYYVLKNGHEKYWYPDATRFIGYNPDTNDKTIHEFPSYSFIVSDLHGHLLDLPVVLTFLALLTSFIVFSKEKGEKLLITLGLGMLLGIMFMTNTWDFGIYLLVAGVTIAIHNLVKKKLSWDFLFETSKRLLTLLVAGLFIAMPFIINFSSIAQGVAFVNARTPIWQLTVLWGFPIVLTIFFIFKLVITRKIDLSKIFVFSLLIAAWILIFLPEFIFVKDIYIGSHHRANTMFKLTYQGFVIFYLASGYIIVSILLSIKKFLLKFLAVLASSIVIASILIYPYFGIKSFYGELKNYKGLDGEAWLERDYPGLYSAILFFRENTFGQPIILEAAGDSYTDFNVISAYSGLPTVSGWFVHEWLWRGTPEFPQARANDVSQIYLTQNLEEAKNLLSKYNVSYVVVGTFERQKYPTLNEEKFEKIGRMVFSNSGVNIYQLSYN